MLFRSLNQRDEALSIVDNHAMSGIRLLVAEDNLINQQVVTKFLNLSGIDVVIANNGKEVLDLLEHETFAAILMDVHMPELDGFQATQLIRTQTRFAKLPIIAVTAGVTEEERQKCLAVGMNDFIAKPIDPKLMLMTLKKYIRSNRFSTGNTTSPSTLTTSLALPKQNPPLLSSKHDIDMKSLKKAMLELNQLLNEDHYIDDELLTRLKTHFPSALQDSYQQLVKSIHNLKYHQARELLRQLTTLLEIEKQP